MKNKPFLNTILFSVLSFIIISLCAPLFAQEEDDHYVQSEQYFIAEQDLTGAWVYVYLSNMITPASKETKNEAKFMMIASGKEKWTKYYYKTRKINETEIKIGLKVICLEAADEESILRAPENEDEAKTGTWFMGKITDVSDKYKGYITVSGEYKVRLDNLRVIVK